MTIWDFAAQHPEAACFLAFIGVVWPVHEICLTIKRAYWMRLRHKNILAHGWPVPPVDADGDIVYPDCEQDEAA